MKFRTVLSQESAQLQIGYNSQLVFIGSCFAENMGKTLLDRKFSASLNPLGISYNPISIAQNLESIVHNKEITASHIHNNNGTFFHYDFHGSNNTQSVDAYLSKVNKTINAAHLNVKHADVLFISLGTANVFNHKDHGIVNNCHKMSNDLFNRRLLSIDEITFALKRIKSLVSELNSKIKIVYTVSPIRHIRDGLVADRRSKSMLIASLTQVLNEEDTFYFPSYELLIDDLRDYRFYKEDLIHPSDQAISYIWEYFYDCYFSSETKEHIKKVEKINGMLAHKIMDPLSLESIRFKRKIKNEINSISNLISINKWQME